MNNPFVEIKDDFTHYFEALGYKVSWDFSHRLAVKWYEIYDDKGLVCQIDMSIPLSYIIKDLIHMYRSNSDKGISTTDYTISAPDDERFNALCERIIKHEKTT